MTIQKTCAIPINFKAQTTIKAPETLLLKEERAYLEAMGSVIGTDADTIEFVISDLKENKFNKNIKEYEASKHYKFKKGSPLPSLNIDGFKVPFIKSGEVIEKNSPYNYIKTAIDRLMKTAFEKKI